jgi:hypothetical protein
LEVRKAILGVDVAEGKHGDRTRKIRVPDKVRCFELLGRHLKLFTEVHRLEGDLDVRSMIAEGRKRTKRGGP